MFSVGTLVVPIPGIHNGTLPTYTVSERDADDKTQFTPLYFSRVLHHYHIKEEYRDKHGNRKRRWHDYYDLAGPDGLVLGRSFLEAELVSLAEVLPNAVR